VNSQESSVGRGLIKNPVAVIGCGNMGAKLVNAISAGFDGGTVFAVDPDVQGAARRIKPNHQIRIIPNLSHLEGETLTAIILAVEPALISSVVKQLRNVLANTTLISVAAGISTEKLRALLPSGAKLVRAMPNLAVAVHEAMIVAYSPPQNLLSTEDVQVVEDIFKGAGRLEWVQNERYLDVSTAVSGSGPAYFFAFVQALQGAAENLGLPTDLAITLSRQVCIGAGRILAEDTRGASELLRAVSSPGGTTESGMAVLNDGLSELVHQTVQAAYHRALALVK
jgi:pyrroline-5-carboxylate reductase